MNAFDVATQTSSAIKKRTFELLRIPKYKESMADGIQVLRYETAQAYVAHHDYFPVGQSQDFNWDPSRGGSNRFATVFLYLSNVEAGGQTCFPKQDRLTKEDYPELMERLGGNPLTAEGIEELLKQAGIAPKSWEAKLTRDCYTKFSIPPKKGDAVLFYSQTPDGHLDPNSLHGAGPVLKGTKWGANVWVWNACRYNMCHKDPLQPAEENDFEY
jgi:prolyl 4-hydroxylase